MSLRVAVLACLHEELSKSGEISWNCHDHPVHSAAASLPPRAAGHNSNAAIDTHAHPPPICGKELAASVHGTEESDHLPDPTSKRCPMDKRTAFAVLFLVSLPVQAQIGQSTNQLLAAPVVQDLLEIRVTPGDGETPGVQYRLDSKDDKGFKTLVEGQTFAAPGEIDLAFPDFSPLRYAVTTKATSVADQNFTGIQSFLDALLGLGRVVFPAREEFQLAGEALRRSPELTHLCSPKMTQLT